MNEKDSPQFWRDLKPGSVLTLSDPQAIEDSIKAGHGVSGIDYTVKYIYKIEELEGLAEWLFFSLSGMDQDLWLMVKIVDKEMAVRIYYEPPEFEPGNRKDMIDRGDLWFFQAPRDPDNFAFNKLRYTLEIIRAIQTESGEKEIVYSLKDQGEMHGKCTCVPEEKGLEELFATVVEYSYEEKIENPELLILELGKADNEEGGLIRFMLGSEIALSDIDVLSV